MRDGLLRNHIHLGCVNAAPRDFHDALAHLGQLAKDRRAGLLTALITARVRPEDSLWHYEHRQPQGIKTVLMYASYAASVPPASRLSPAGTGYHTPVHLVCSFLGGVRHVIGRFNWLPLRSALSTQTVTEEALREAIAAARESLGGSPDLAILFFSPHHAGRPTTWPPTPASCLGTTNVLGCTGEAIVGTGREVEDEPALSLWLARWPGVTLTPLHLEFERTPEGGVLDGWPDELAGEWPAGSFLIVLGEPFSFPADFLLERMNEDRPGVPVVGGMASGAAEPGDNRLFLGPHTLAEGAVAVHVSRPVRLRTVVSQGCRPIGRPFVVTKAERNVIHELGGKPALVQLREIFDALPTREQRLVQRALHVGRVVSEYQERFEQGDFLVRNVVGIDPNSGAIAIGDYIRPGQTVQFHVRDQEAADAELKQLLGRRSAKIRHASRRADCSSPATAAARGCSASPTTTPPPSPPPSARFPSPASSPRARSAPSAGQNFIHGFTASIALFESEA